MSTVKTFVVLVGVWFGLGLGFANVARAGTPIEFEFGGVFTQTSGTVFQPGQSFTTTVRFDPDTPDMDPSPLRGRYTYISWTVPYRTSTPIVVVPPSGEILVDADNDGSSHSWVLRNEGGSLFFYEILLNFPSGTFANDALQPPGDLQQATFNRFRGIDGAFGFEVEGVLNSFRVVPEPATAMTLCALALVRAGRRRRIP